jgi:hypothetical protein
MKQIQFVVEDEENNRLTIEASRLGLSKSALFKLLFKGFMGEVKIERKAPDSENQSVENKG